MDMTAVFNLERLAGRGLGVDPISSKPWKSAAHAPSEPPPVTTLLPPDNLRLEWVHGYRAQVSWGFPLRPALILYIIAIVCL